ncbi:DNA repair and recombination protein RAD54B [Cryptococcus neoformans C23]|uniref:DNA repair and recombination protein RAD54B n=1 Tax=Cryptococcus neoformans (strain H99 / ATCC 208821 / CBS 10515 / FGSC 9487) TaxID=235443 RepID=J9VKI0_CRYN9|nr:DNA repair and recombination protein RAD54B [Cryptococcus neoformans var. grubii H99]AUB23513.1 DNA repair and recombination protein RAD54B [Cryptococcus neoformans var. grubii]OWZ46580.1 DNA repair and recombination protein RAD54B [Cryptococcus neoformans var. grubii C23]OXG84927.1 DNA repair and recombination protein RAD54B [Cryptococcus neoformans var. grubii MW-RSA36]OXL10061.1 DNA repair and recombination protein RAD54B [Cryptococcus neoformans var. grubii Gb118]AFR93921.2 DNA repair a|eukprot:XP_012047906.1 DNA repair and recombination protein RAD54B [Cryptococcus neoformans var. grubii H99]
MAIGTVKPRRSLGAIIDSIPSQQEYVPDSCSENSGSDSERDAPIPTLKPIPLTPLPSRPTRLILELGAEPITTGKENEREGARAVPGDGKIDKKVHGVVDTLLMPVLYFAVQWRKPQFKKHKTWDGDANIKVEGNRIVMLDEDGNQMATTNVGDKVIKPEAEFKIGGYEIMVDHVLQQDQFKASTNILNRPRVIPTIKSSGYRPSSFAKPFRPPIQKANPISTKPPTMEIIENEHGQSPISSSSKRSIPTPAAAQRAVAASSFYTKQSPKPFNERIVLGEKSNKERLQWGGALFNPHAEGAVVMPRPGEKLAKLRGTTIVDVVIDPVLGDLLREHQKEGVKFMYSCVMGMTGAEGEGCILADEMGLGKTLQTIALIYTMLKQSPFANQTSIIGKAIIVCPVTLVDNWRKEFKKWVDRRVNVLVADGTDYRVSSFVNNKHQHVLIIGYERLRKVVKELASCIPPIDLIVCDEGHRLKSKDNKTTKMFDMLKTQRRIILSGTPVQNDLGEYWAMVNFACPGVLGKYSAFAKHYEKPILKSRTPNCSAKDVELGRERANDLAKLSKEFVLRRTAAVLENYLPPKYEYVIFIAPSLLQLSVLSNLLDPNIVRSFIRGYGAQSLALIDLMRKISNSPMLLKRNDNELTRADDDLGSATSAAISAIPSETNINDVTTSGKMLLLDKMLHSIYQCTQEKVVVVSNWTSTLDLIQGLCKLKRYNYLRLDGSTPPKQRQDLVDRFNKDQGRQGSFVFLLSAKAGGVGLNLIGGSRLILFDSDWNPSTDLQAMARIHRDGQKRPVYIYRFLTTNAIDEKIYQRQITKTGLSDQMMDQTRSEKQTSKDSFSAAELRDIFTLNLQTDGCQTHDLLGCQCIKKPAGKTRDIAEGEHSSKNLPDNASGKSDSDENDHPTFVSANKYDPEPTPKMRRKAIQEQKNKLAALKHWAHFDPFEPASFRGIQDSLLYNVLFDSWETDSTLLSQNIETYGSPAFESPHESDEDDPDSDEEVSVPKKRKSGIPRSAAVLKKTRAAGEENTGFNQRRYNLRSIAESGGTGRVTFVFEKISKSTIA